MRLRLLGNRPASTRFRCHWVGRSRLIPMTLFAISFASIARADEPQVSLKTPDRFERFAPVEPGRAESTFRVQAGFRMELIASEPLVTDPVAMTIDESGRAFVVEMNDYPYTDAKQHRPWQENPTDAPIGRVRMLVDSDRDGVYDRGTIFANDLSWPSGILCHRGGVIVTATPDIWFLKDTDGDGVADQRERLVTGFRKYNVQAVMNNPIWGLDNHIYVAGSSNGGSVMRPDQPAVKPIVARGDYRIDPITSRIESQAGGARFGNTFDDFGNRFLCNIRNPAIHVVVDSRYSARNPFYAAPALSIDVAAAGDQLPIYRISPIEPWRELRGRQWSADPTKKLPRSELTGGGVFTSTSGITVYRGDAYPETYSGQLFLGEVANNVVYRQTLVPHGNTFAAERADAGVEFVASDDTWFRPVNLYNAPDGTLYVLDMYREFIEHPWSIPDDIHARLDLTSGRDRGRIYRLAPADFRFDPDDLPELGNRSTRELVETLRHRGSWWRETAQRLIVERGDGSEALALRRLLREEPPLPAVHALWTLVGLAKLERADLLDALSHPHPRVREQALRIAEPQLKTDADLFAKAVLMSNDNDPRLRLQLLFSLGEVDSSRSLAAIARLAKRDGTDPWARVAIGCLPPKRSLELLKALIDDPLFFESPAAPAVFESLTDIAGAVSPSLGSAVSPKSGSAVSPKSGSAVSPSQDATGPSPLELVWQATRRVWPDASALPRIPDRQSTQSVDADAIEARAGPDAAIDALWNGLANGARRKGKGLNDLRLAAHSIDDAALAKSLDRDSQIAADDRYRDTTRIAATTRLVLAGVEDAPKRLGELLSANQPQGVQLAAVRGMATFQDPRVTELLLKQLPKVTPAVREELLTTILARPERTLALLNSIGRDEIPAAMIGLVRKETLLASTNAQVRELAQRILSRGTDSRQAIFDRYRDPVRLRSGEADLNRGLAVFTQHCATCHRLNGMGNALGPHLETVRDWDVDRLLLNILDPNREVAPQSMSHAIVLGDGRLLAGLIADETAASLTLKRAGVADEVVLRAEIETLSNTGQSFMPSGFDELISPADMADLIAYIRKAPH